MTDLNEIWKQIRESKFEGIYEASTHGRIRRIDSGNILKQTIRGAKYLGVSFAHSGRKKTMCVHRMIAMTHIPNPENLPLVNHKDGNRQNNHVNNLEWTTYKGNTAHALETKLTKPAVRRVQQWSYDGDILISTFNSIQEAEMKTGVGNRLISQVCRDQKPTAHGFRWKYEDDFSYIPEEKINGLPIPEFPKYLITRDGQVYSSRTKRYLIPNSGGDYLSVALCNNTIQKRLRIHILVAQVYIPQPKGKHIVNHLNSDKTDNRVENLEWTTASGNMLHAAEAKRKQRTRNQDIVFID